MNKRSAGFTIMEVSLAVMFLAVGLLSLTAMFSQIVRSDFVVRQKRIAAFLAASKLAQLRTLPLVGARELGGTFDEEFQGYNWQAQLCYRPENSRVAELWLQVKGKSSTAVQLWTQVAVKNVK